MMCGCPVQSHDSAMVREMFADGYGAEDIAVILELPLPKVRREMKRLSLAGVFLMPGFFRKDRVL